MSKHPIQNYQILKVIGKGAFAIVYQAQHIKTKEIVAIKQINIDMEEGLHKQKMLELFHTEISIMKSIRHKNIVELKEVQQSQDSINMILEYCAQGDLEKYIKKNSLKNRLPESEAKPIILQLIDAMKMLRLKNIVHRDLKLANILINEQMQIKLGDFGFAKSLINTDLLESYCGTPITMAPEILKKSNSYDHKCDIWSLGVMIYQILFGQPPFVPQKGTVQDLLIAIQTSKLQFPQHISVSAECKDVLRKMLVEDPKLRISFEDLFRHPWCYLEKIDLEKSFLKVNVPQHQEFIGNFQYSINQYKQQLNQIVQIISSIENKYKDLTQFCVRFKNILNGAFNSFSLKIYYSNQNVQIKLPENYKYFNYRQELLLFLINIYEVALQNDINIYEFLNLNIFEYQISNQLEVRYDDYSVSLLDEFKNYKQNNDKNVQMLQFQDDNLNKNKVVNSDLWILKEYIKERYKQ
ncbi:unnamed protein product [Paramecium primaurelia]|uniref:Protein kinase domain-containing protein n=1 Tax=Paramecium primaurelia TaxID=5886 RepID=A0A8S1N3T0_PARPR|nr:unnamed protein product [Paramecium primaurelia]